MCLYDIYYTEIMVTKFIPRTKNWKVSYKKESFSKCFKKVFQFLIFHTSLRKKITTGYNIGCQEKLSLIRNCINSLNTFYKHGILLWNFFKRQGTFLLQVIERGFVVSITSVQSLIFVHTRADITVGSVLANWWHRFESFVNFC